MVAEMGPLTWNHLLVEDFSLAASCGQHAEMALVLCDGAVLHIRIHAASCSLGMMVVGSGGNCACLPSGKATRTAVVGHAPASAKPVARTKLALAEALDEGATPTAVCP